jgi:voltage-gated potassium channel Kch
LKKFIIEVIPMKKYSLRERLRYRFDNIMARGTPVLVFWLGLISVALVMLVSGIVFSQKLAPEMNFWQVIWGNFLGVLGGGPLEGDTNNWLFILAMLLMTLGGLFIVSSLIGILTTGLDAKLESLRKGRSRVIETGHTVILGWSEEIFTIIAELVNANISRKKSCVVIMGEKDKVEMEEEIRTNLSGTGRIRLVCREGNPILLNDLEIVSLDTAKSIIILSPDQEDPDSHVIKVVLAITNNRERKKGPYHIVTELHDPKNLNVVKLVGEDEVEAVLVGDLIARIVAQTCRQSGLSSVYTELLDFGGNEIYFHQPQELAGKTYGAVLYAFETATVIGIAHSARATLNPPMERKIKADERLIVIATDETTIIQSQGPGSKTQPDLITGSRHARRGPEKTLMLGWNWCAVNIIHQLDFYSPPKSNLTVVANAEDAAELIKEKCAGLKNLKVAFISGDTSDRRTLDRLEIENYAHVVLLCYSDTLDNQPADSKTLITLLHLRDIREKTGVDFSIVSEMLDIGNRNLAEVTKVNDFIVSDKIVSLLMAQIAENKLLSPVFQDLFSSEGSEIYIHPLQDYVKSNRPVDFCTVIAAAAALGETAIGYQIAAQAKEVSQKYGIVLNPPKTAAITFREDDRLIVLAES